ncbi:SDR family NAD(P)-dependent oxidoreductase [Methylocella silvestris]|uniref:Short-chain dehydrogenase n=1 Tax=Methylocella silvestris TaxID=199596 RepID=A0A2J7TGM3_METSI|nr:SDR family NAD(P)-dependent oxidoreductase [Methylocella silvestris]PNG25911.1 short-chain dehydrogenase [Methylocella silvestris]
MAARSVLITGASSGIGRALALAYAQKGARLALIGRNPERLEAVAGEARARGAEVTTGLVDVRDRAAMAAFIGAEDLRRPFDLCVANAGITTGLKPGESFEDPDAVRALLAANLYGVLNTAEPLLRPMCARKAGQLAFIGSIAGLRGLPYSPAYCASKAAVHAYAESLRARLEPEGLCISLVIAGFVKTPLNDSIDAMKPLEISDAAAANIIRRGLDRRKAVIAFPWPLYALARFGRILPPRLVDKILARVEVRAPKTQERAASPDAP